MGSWLELGVEPAAQAPLLKCPAPPQFWGLASAAVEAVEDVCYAMNIAQPRRLIHHPAGGSSGYFTSPTRGSAESRFRLNSDSQEDREGPQLTSSTAAAGSLRPPP